VLAKLEAKQLVRREVDPADTRAKRLRVTEAGAALARRSIGVVDAVDAAFFGQAPDRAALMRQLDALR